MNKFRVRLKELRIQNRLTQKEICKLLSKSETGYASWEQGLSEPSINDICKLCTILNTSADYLLGIVDY